MDTLKKFSLSVVFLTLIFCSVFQSLLRAEDCGIRGYDGSNIVKLDCEVSPPAPSALRVAIKSGSGTEMRSLTLVDPKIPGPVSGFIDNPAASKFRVSYSESSQTVIKAIGLISAGISTCEELQMIGYHPDYSASSMQLGSDIDCSKTNPAAAPFNCSVTPTPPGSLWQCGYAARYPNGFDEIALTSDDPVVSGSPSTVATSLSLANLGPQGFRPLFFDSSQSFQGTFDGNGHKITGLYIDRGTRLLHVGLFGKANNAIIRNVVLSAAATATATEFEIHGSLLGVGGLIGSGSATVQNCSSTVNVWGNGSGSSSGVGGLVGRGTFVVRNSFFNGIVKGRYAGGIAGSLLAGSLIETSHSSGSVQGDGTTTYAVGGLVGRLVGSISQSYSESNVFLDPLAGTGGGLVGEVSNGYINDSYAVGDVEGGKTIGGLVGVGSGGAIMRCYARGALDSSSSFRGGLLGTNGSTGYGITNVSHSFSTSTQGNGLVGGWVVDCKNAVCSGAPVLPKNLWWYNNDLEGIACLTYNPLAPNSYATAICKDYVLSFAGFTRADSISDFNGFGSGTGQNVFNQRDPNTKWNFINVWNGPDPENPPKLR